MKTLGSLSQLSLSFPLLLLLVLNQVRSSAKLAKFNLARPPVSSVVQESLLVLPRPS